MHPTRKPSEAQKTQVTARMVQVIEVEHTRGGTGGDPLRFVRTYWDMQGNWVAENDPLAEKTPEPATRKFQHHYSPAKD